MTNLNNLLQNKIVPKVLAFVGLVCISLSVYFDRYAHSRPLLVLGLNFIFWLMLSLAYSFPAEILGKRISPKVSKIISTLFGIGTGIALYKILMVVLF